MEIRIKNLIQLSLITFLLVFLNSCNGQIENTANNDGKAKQTNQLENHNANSKSFDKNIRSVFQDKNGNYWFGTNGEGVFRYDKKTLKQFTVKDGLADNQVISIQEDEQGNLWFGSGSFNISKFDGEKFTSQKNNIDLLTRKETIWKSLNNDVWFYAGDGVFRQSNSSIHYLPFDRSSSNDPFKLSRYGVYCILKDKKGNIWFGTQAEGVCKFDGKSLTWLKEKGLAGPAVLGVFEDKKGNLWFGNNGAGLFRFDGVTLTNFTEEMGLNNEDFIVNGKSKLGSLARVYTINEDIIGNLWIGTVDSGVWKYDGEKLTNYTTDQGLTSNSVNTIYKDKNGELWFGTDSNGICKFNGTSFYEFVIK
jgi:ligand-binding sensor domain-containing protein